MKYTLFPQGTSGTLHGHLTHGPTKCVSVSLYIKYHYSLISPLFFLEKISINGSSTVFFLHPNRSSCTPSGLHTPLFRDHCSWDSQPYSLFSWAQSRDCQHLSGLHIDGRQSVPTCKKTYTSRHMPIKKTYA